MTFAFDAMFFITLLKEKEEEEKNLCNQQCQKKRSYCGISRAYADGERKKETLKDRENKENQRKTRLQSN